MISLRPQLVGASAALLLLVAPSAHAATRYATPTGTGKSCSADVPCALADAITGAGAGDDVVLAPGEYSVIAPLKPASGVSVEGMAGQPRPRLLGSDRLAGDTLQLASGGIARHLEIRGGSNGSGAALRLRGAMGEDLVIATSAPNGSAAVLMPSTSGTSLRNALAICRDCGDGAVAFHQNQNGATATAFAVTAVATGRAAAVQSDLSDGIASLVDVAVRGESADISAGSAPIRVKYSAFRRDASAGITGEGNNVGAPLFADAAGGDFHQAPGSPTLDAGVADQRAGATDLDGAARVSGAAQDIGAYEAPSPTGSGPGLGAATGLGTIGGPNGPDPVGGSLAPAGRPSLHRSVAVAPAAGTVLVRLPDSARAVALDDPTKLPLGTEIDARDGAVRLTSATSATGAQTGLFSGGRFRVRQTSGSRPVTELVLTGGDFSRCPRAGAARAAKKGPIRRLWGRDRGGRFKTIGRSASATVRGTRWLTADSCEGTRVTVSEGAVAVRPRRGGRATTVRAGHSLLVTARKAS